MEVETKLQTTNSKTALETMFRPAGSSESTSRGVKRKSGESVETVEIESDDEEVNDEVRLWEDGFKDRYYESKFDVGSGQMEFRYGLNLFVLKLNEIFDIFLWSSTGETIFIEIIND